MMSSNKPTDPSLPAQARIMDMALGAWRTKVVSETTRFGIPDLVKQQGPMTAAEMTSKGGIAANTDALERLLRAAASLGLLTEDSDGRFGPTELSEELTCDAPQSLKKLVENMGDFWLRFFMELFDAVKTGSPQAKKVFGMELWDYLLANPKELENFGEAMKSNSFNSLRGVLTLCDFQGAGRIADIAGGFGHLIIALLEKYPDLEGILLESHEVISAAKIRNPVTDESVAGRLSYIGGDMFNSVPPANVYIMKHIIHDWEDEKCIRLLMNCHQSMEGEGRVICVDSVLPPMGNTENAAAKLLDLQMLSGITGKERTEVQWRTIFEAAGFKISKITSLQDNFGTSIVEGVKR